MSSPWPAPHATHPVVATVRVPGSKSLTNRCLVLAALASGPSLLRGGLRARDTDLMVGALRALGVGIEEVPGDDPVLPDWLVAPGDLRGVSLDCGLAGTVMRFVPALAGLAHGDVRLDGDDAARVRPLAPLAAAVREAGVAVTGDALPLVVHGRGRVPGGLVHVDASTSSQFVSALLLAGARYDDGLTLRHTGATLPSAPHIEMTLETLRDVGVVVDVTESDADGTPRQWRVEPGEILPLDVRIEPDLSSAAPFLAAAAVTGGQVTVPDWPCHTTQAGDRMREVLLAMGCSAELDRDGLTVTGPASGRLRGVDLDLGETGELTPVIAALAALAAPGQVSRLTGITHLRGHETDRLAALAAELTALGGDVDELEDGLVIRAVPLAAPPGHVTRTYGDHRMAQAAAVLGLAVPGVQLDDVATAAKTMPGFDRAWCACVGGGDGGQTAE